MLIKLKTFKDKTQKKLLSKIERALTNLGGHGTAKDGAYLTAPVRLDAERDLLRSDYKAVWQRCTIEFDPQERGASIKNKKQIRFGPFFLQDGFTVTDVEKVILHEYLHAALRDIWQGDAAHSQMEQIISYNLNYPGAWNPAGMAD